MLFLASLRDYFLNSSTFKASPQLLTRIDKILFCCSDTSEFLRTLAQNNISEKDGSYKLEEGKLLPESRLTPSFQDRSMFYTLLTATPIQKLFSEKFKSVKFSENNHLVQTKQIFDKLIESYFKMFMVKFVGKKAKLF